MNEDGRFSASIWASELTNGSVESNYFKKGGIRFDLNNLKTFGELFQARIMSPILGQTNLIFKNANFNFIVERHGQNVQIDIDDQDCFKNLGRDFDYRYNWSFIDNISIAWTIQIHPNDETDTFYPKKGSLFMSKKGIKKVMENNEITDFRKGGLAELCNYQSKTPFTNIENFIRDKNRNDSVYISGQMVIYYIFRVSLTNFRAKFILLQNIS